MFPRGSDLTTQALAGEVELRHAPWSCRAALDATKPAEVGAGIPIAQGSKWIVGDAVLEIKQPEQIGAVAMYC